MEASAVDNDTRGWIMSAVSGIACVMGAAVICVDVVVRQFPGKRDFRIQDSNVFLASSLSLSFGVMLFSALYSMLPSSKPYLVKAGYPESTASLVVMSAFVGGFVGIQVVSRVMHRFMPSHVVDCDHSHGQAGGVEGENRGESGCRGGNGKANGYGNGRGRGRNIDGDYGDHDDGHDHDHDPHRHHSHPNHANSHSHSHFHSHSNHNHDTPPPDENTPLVGPDKPKHSQSWTATGTTPSASRNHSLSVPSAPSVFHVPQRVLSFVQDTKSNCAEVGPCYGYTDPCAQECFKHLGARPGTAAEDREGEGEGQGRLQRARSHNNAPHDDNSHRPSSSSFPRPPQSPSGHSRHSHHSHHHHVPTNAFMALSLQTSIAITLHKFPEGFITYATNHANPALGFSVFTALFVHNISEGFALALPLYMALQSRARALLWTALLGGLSQPLGAGMAALWLHIAAGRSVAPGAVFYAVLFAVTAGIMVSVALQLFAESMSLCHNRNLCIFFGFLGMALLGFSGALVGEHQH